eukprot:6189424-Pleurochrysis_carterae.AAC.1
MAVSDSARPWSGCISYYNISSRGFTTASPYERIRTHGSFGAGQRASVSLSREAVDLFGQITAPLIAVRNHISP